MLHALFHLLGSHYEKDNLGEVEGILRSILATVPNDPTSMKFLGLVYYRTGRTDEAVRIFEMAAHQQQSESAVEMPPRGDFLARHGYSAVAACHLEATRPDSNTARTWYDLGLALRDLGRRDEAQVAFRHAGSARQHLPEVRFDSAGPADTPTAGVSAAETDEDD
jgi:Flp pilus assembly protein TadD